MTILRPGRCLLALAAATAQAADQTPRTALQSVSVRDGARVVVDCRDERLPSLRLVGDVLETNNASRIYSERERLVHIAHRECMRGSASVAFVRDAADNTPALAMATPTR